MIEREKESARASEPETQISQLSSSPASSPVAFTKTMPLLFQPPLRRKSSASPAGPSPWLRSSGRGRGRGLGAGAGARPRHKPRSSSGSDDSSWYDDPLSAMLHSLLASLGVGEGARGRRMGIGAVLVVVVLRMVVGVGVLLNPKSKPS